MFSVMFVSLSFLGGPHVTTVQTCFNEDTHSSGPVCLHDEPLVLASIHMGTHPYSGPPDMFKVVHL